METQTMFDPALALERAGGNRDLARELLTMFLGELPAFQRRIGTRYEATRHRDLLEAVHKLNGSSTYCGVPAIKQAADGYEGAMKRGENARYDTLHADLCIEIARLMQNQGLLNL